MKFSSEFENVTSKIGGKSETGGKMHHGLRGEWTPLKTGAKEMEIRNEISKMMK